LISDIKKYFIQQSEIYGRDFYIDFKLDARPSVVSADERHTLDQFGAEIRDCQKCKLSKSRTQVVFGSGAADAKLMCIGEAPGKEEDKQGEPFVGAAGNLLTKILAAINFSRDEVYIANIIKCRPPENRDPEEDEIVECLPYLRKQIELIKPVVILALGLVAAQSLLGVSGTISSMRTQEKQYQGIPVFVTYHPAALLRNADLKRATWEDVKKLRKVYDSLAN